MLAVIQTLSNKVATFNPKHLQQNPLQRPVTFIEGLCVQTVHLGPGLYITVVLWPLRWFHCICHSTFDIIPVLLGTTSMIDLLNQRLSASTRLRRNEVLHIFSCVAKPLLGYTIGQNSSYVVTSRLVQWYVPLYNRYLVIIIKYTCIITKSHRRTPTL